jgi:hypothetical protein
MGVILGLSAAPHAYPIEGCGPGCPASLWVGGPGPPPMRAPCGPVCGPPFDGRPHGAVASLLADRE